MKELAQLLNAMLADRVIHDYALFGAVAQMRYTEPVATLDADILVGLPPSNRLDVLGEIYEYCAARGWQPEGESIRVGAWPAQFVPAFDALTREAMAQAETADFDNGVPLRVVRADYLAAIALSVGRAKDLTDLALLEAGSASREAIRELVSRHGLTEAWKRFESRFMNE